MAAPLLRGDAGCLPLTDASVDLVVTSPPYWQLRAYATGHPADFYGLAGDLAVGEVGS